RGAAGVADDIVARRRAGPPYADGRAGDVVQAVVPDDMAGRHVPAQVDADPESADAAVANRDVLAVVGVDPVGLGADAAPEPAELEVVAVDGDIVGVDRDRRAGVDAGGQVVAQAPHALGRDARRERVDVAGATVETVGR